VIHRPVLDGNPAPVRPEQLPGLDPARAGAELTRLHAAFTAMTDAMAAPLSADQVARALAGAAAVNPGLRVVHLAGVSHAMTAERPRQLADLVGGRG
jgi:hypothetical protein